MVLLDTVHTKIAVKRKFERVQYWRSVNAKCAVKKQGMIRKLRANAFKNYDQNLRSRTRSEPSIKKGLR